MCFTDHLGELMISTFDTFTNMTNGSEQEEMNLFQFYFAVHDSHYS